MAQPQRGPKRGEVGDLRNIVDRLDLIMETSANASAGPSGSARPQIDETLAQLSDRIDAVEREAGELRALVNHLMTIATWQAKVTATLVEEQEAASVSQGDRQAPPDTNGGQARTSPLDRGERQAQTHVDLVDEGTDTDTPHHDVHGPPEQPREPAWSAEQPRERAWPPDRTRDRDWPRRPAASLEDDIDDILGTHREQSSQTGPPPDFGI